MRKPPYPKLPKQWGGVPLVRGKGMHYKKLDKLVEECAFAFDEWPLRTNNEFFIVVDNRKDESDLRDGKVFGDKATAVAYAKAMGNGNCDQRVLRCRNELLVVSTDNNDFND